MPPSIAARFENRPTRHCWRWPTLAVSVLLSACAHAGSVHLALPEPVPEEAVSDEPPPGDDLGLDADGVAADGFGLTAKKGGRGLIGGGDRNRWYAGVIQRDLQGLLADNDDARGAKYSVVVKLWISADGKVERFEIGDSTGDDESDKALRETLSGLHLSDSPPEEMPQPVRLRVVSR